MRATVQFDITSRHNASADKLKAIVDELLSMLVDIGDEIEEGALQATNVHVSVEASDASD